MCVVTSTLHRSLKFFSNNQVVMVKADPKVVHLCELMVASWASIVSTLKNCILSLSKSTKEVALSMAFICQFFSPRDSIYYERGEIIKQGQARSQY